MNFQKILTATAAILIVSSAASAAQTPTRMNQYNDWGTYSYSDTSGKVCYILSTPKQMQPANVDHGDIFFLVSQKPGQGIAYEPQLVMGYELKEDDKVEVDIDGTKFTMFSKKDSAWMENAAQEPQLVASLRAGRSMTISATSKRGTDTRYTYSLSGVTAALNSIKDCK
ncbi:invasion associated locus B family protein [Fulvimarina sp. 2208YS6-2-32]|uniref:Invasion associated locus B family protein n=1 Tax=Fulvimarina uroteuthidis TaxID=3098149 RepID=A0ABU5HX19_9HYPH|nr:invasion associated locus B family protein [Fulvimarina sp. 2208YS6-2-32]MDY8107632.1 invasion associated locus B family protein [Fulvimarina sp. 2208YS6-2-32]